MNDNPLFQLLRSDGSLTINKALIHAIGLNEAILYCELVSKYFYFEENELLSENNTFYNSIKDLFLSTGIHEKSQKTAIKRLEKFGLLKVAVLGMPKKRYFKMNFDNEIITKLLSTGKQNILSLKQEIEQKTSEKLRNISIPPKGDIDKAIEQLLKTPKGSLNNTKLNNTMNNTNLKVIKGSFLAENFSLSLEYYLDIINFYLNTYETTMGEQHPIMNKSNWNKVLEALSTLEDQQRDIDFDVDFESEENMIEQYFNTDFGPTCDRNILHYISGDIRVNRMYEVAY